MVFGRAGTKIKTIRYFCCSSIDFGLVCPSWDVTEQGRPRQCLCELEWFQSEFCHLRIFFPICRKGECDWLKAQAHLGKVWDGIPYGWSCTEFLSTVAFAQFLDKEKTKTVRKPCWRQIILFLDDFTFSPVVGLHYKAAISAVTDLGSASHLLGFALGSLELNGSCSLVANFCKAK